MLYDVGTTITMEAWTTGSSRTRTGTMRGARRRQISSRADLMGIEPIEPGFRRMHIQTPAGKSAQRRD